MKKNVSVAFSAPCASLSKIGNLTFHNCTAVSLLTGVLMFAFGLQH